MTSQAGQSLVGVLISVAMMGIILLIMTSMFEYQNRETRALSEKLGSTDLEKTLVAALADGSVCQYALNNPTVLTFDTTLVSPSTPQTINLSSPLYASINPGPPQTPGPVVAQIGQAASGYSGTLIVNSIQLSITSGSGNTYVGNWLIGFDNSKIVRAMRPVSISTTLTVSTTGPNSPTAAAITGCQGSTANGCWVEGPNGLTETTCGNVGIGTTSPQQNLSVNGYLSVDQGDTDIGAIGVYHGISFGNASGESIGSKRSAGGNKWGLDFYTGWATRMSIASSGNVGIGTTSPNAPLTVSRNTAALSSVTSNTLLQLGNADGQSTTIRVESYGTSVTPGINLRLARGTAASPSAVQHYDWLGVIGASAYGATGFSSNTSSFLGFQAAENWTDTAQGANILLDVTPAGSTSITTAMYVSNNSGISVGAYARNFTWANPPTDGMIVSGNVGIGTAAPDAMLSVNGSADKPGGGSWGTFSDARLKTVTGPFTRGIDEVKRLNPIYYHYNDGNIAGVPNDGEHVGFVAQDVQKVVPEAVSANKDGILKIENDSILWTMLNAVKELERENAQLKTLVCQDHPTAAICRTN